jgi:hypothetical protein
LLFSIYCSISRILIVIHILEMTLLILLFVKRNVSTLLSVNTSKSYEFITSYLRFILAVRLFMCVRVYLYIYIYMCVCVCVCVRARVKLVENWYKESTVN